MGEGTVLHSSNAAPLCRYGKRWFFRCDGEAIYDFESGSADVVTIPAPLKRLGYPTVLRLRVYAPTEPFYHDLPINEVPDLGDVRALPLYGFAID